MTGDFPPDILKLARSVVDRGYDEGLVDAVARVLWEERPAQAERDAQIAESPELGNEKFGQVAMYGWPRAIAAAIRASVKP